MQKLISLALALWSLVAIVSAHGTIKSPTQRGVGTAMFDACGETLYNNQKADPAGNIEGLLKILPYDQPLKPTCHLWLCKGYQFDDNKSNVYGYSLGEVVPIEVDIHAVSRPVPPRHMQLSLRPGKKGGDGKLIDWR